MKLASLGLVALCSCAPASPPYAPHFWGDTPVVENGGAVREALGEPHPDATAAVLFVNFTGSPVQGGGENATSIPPLSSIAGNAAQIPSFNPTINAPKVSAPDAQDAVFDRLRTFYLPYNLTLTRTRPASGSYTMILVGGSHTAIGEPTGVAGVSPLDCGNGNPSNVVFDFSDDQSPDYGGVVSVAITGAHESGHSYGLQHTDDPTDIMFSVDPATLTQTLPQLFTLGFGSSGTFSSFNADGQVLPVSCSLPTSGVNSGLLAAALGTKTVPPSPTLGWDFPPATSQMVPLSIPLHFTPSAGSRVEVYKNLELIAVLKSAPYATTVTAADKEGFYLTADAIDANAARSTSTRTYVAEAKTPALCSDSSMCPSGRTCKDAFCRLPLGSACKSTLDCLTSFCKAVPGAPGLTCTQVCDASNPCSADGTCTGGLCVPTSVPDGGMSQLKNQGDACADGTECVSGRCQDVCVPGCDDQTPCATGTCQDVSGGLGCAGAMTTPPASGCAVAGRAPAPFAWGLALLLFGVALRNGRRERGVARDVA